MAKNTSLRQHVKATQAKTELTKVAGKKQKVYYLGAHEYYGNMLQMYEYHMLHSYRAAGRRQQKKQTS